MTVYFVAAAASLQLGSGPDPKAFILFGDHLFSTDASSLARLHERLHRRNSRPAPVSNYTMLSQITDAPRKAKSPNLIEIYFDIETLVSAPFQAYSLGFQVDDGEVHFIHGPDCCETFVEMTARIAADHPKDQIAVYGFNAYKFDYVYLLPHILKRFRDSTILVGSPTDIKMLHSDNIRWEDLRALLGGSGSLRGFAESFHLPL